MPVRISGPLVSSSEAHSMPVFLHAMRRLSSVPWWYSCEPWLKLKRATRMPARSISSSLGTSRDTGPRVQMMLVLFFTSSVAPGLLCLQLAPLSRMWGLSVASLLAPRLRSTKLPMRAIFFPAPPPLASPSFRLEFPLRRIPDISFCLRLGVGIFGVGGLLGMDASQRSVRAERCWKAWVEGVGCARRQSRQRRRQQRRRRRCKHGVFDRVSTSAHRRRAR
mmetsp:Transcript_27269/g.66982  ORF Transcript_27269/g.66982 Transcript_27269/m.66982 type:complete len:221 (+) Transcript_27269:1390-2052(+)